MNQDEFTAHAHAMMDACTDLLVIKGGEYAGSTDRLANFKRGAALTGTTPLQVAFIYASKHYDSVATYVRDQASGTERPRSETILSRFQDLMNYMLLMAAIVKEGELSVTTQAIVDPSAIPSDITMPGTTKVLLTAATLDAMARRMKEQS